jgi:hypothetical protein
MPDTSQAKANASSPNFRLSTLAGQSDFQIVEGMHPVDEIFAAFGNSPTRLARAAAMDVRTVDAWKREPKNIPKWRRAGVLGAVRRSDVSLPAAAIAYLEDDGSIPVTASAPEVLPQ